MMNQDDGQVELALKLAQEAKQGSHLGGVVLIALVQTDQGIQDEQDGFENAQSLFETLAIGRQVQAKGDGRDDVQGHIGQGDGRRGKRISRRRGRSASAGRVRSEPATLAKRSVGVCSCRALWGR